MTSGGRLGIVVVNFGSHALLRQNLAKIGATEGEDIVVVVVDNFSSGDERASVSRLADAEGWAVVTTASNLGFGTGMNRGVARAIALGCERILLLNPDVAIDLPTITALRDASCAAPSTILTPRLERVDGSTWFAGGQLDRRRGTTTTRPDGPRTGPDRWLTGACLMIDRTSWDQIGGFDDSFFLYWEDIDLSQRFLELGGELRVVDELVAVHSVGGTQGTEGKSAVYCYFNCRNRLRFAERHLAARDRLRWLWFTPAYALRTVFLSGRRHALRHPSIVWASIRGSVAGAVAVLFSVVRDRDDPAVRRPSP
jgi:GT2 family glycosyltransferase